MKDLQVFLENFIKDANAGELKTAHYPKEWLGMNTKVSFGMGAPARVPWIGFLGEGMTVSRGINPVYLFYKDLQTLILAYGVSETQESPETWPADVINKVPTIESFFDKNVPRYGDSFVFKAYKVEEKNGKVNFTYSEEGQKASIHDLDSDLKTLISYYQKVLSLPSYEEAAESRSQGLFYMEKQLEDFIIFNWENTELGKKYDLIIEEGDLRSQQYRTDIGPIDILATDKKTNGYVVIELKKDQTSDDTVGQLARYMGWVRKHLAKGKEVKGVIIAGKYDKKLDYALEMVSGVEVFLYEVDFNLRGFEK